MSPRTELAHAKVNLALRIISREPDGYHRLETVFQALELHDTLEATLSHETTLRVDGDVDVGPLADNLVLRAARAFRDEVPAAPHVAFRLTKRIPSQAGLGGGSSDAAAALRLLNRLSGDPLERARLARIGARLGADVPFFLAGSPLATATGRGDRIEPVPPLPAVPVVLVDPRVGISTRAAFERWDAAHPQPAAPAGLPARIEAFDAARAWARNDFEEVVFERMPHLAAARDALLRAGATIALLSGSGSCVFGLFADGPPGDSIERDVRAIAPDAAVLRTRTLA